MSDFSGAGLILAAGASRRMGQPKALLPYRGGTFLGHLWDRLQELQLPWTRVVTSPDLVVPMPHLVNPETARGPIGSIQLALRMGAGDYPWLLVVAVDRPRVSPHTFAKLCHQAQQSGAHVIVPAYQGRRGHPIIFARCCYADLLAAPDDPGARWVVARHRDQRLEVEVDDPAILEQFDTPEQLAKMQEASG